MPPAVRKVEAGPPGAGTPSKVAANRRAVPYDALGPKREAGSEEQDLDARGMGTTLTDCRGCSSYALRSRPHQRAGTRTEQGTELRDDDESEQESENGSRGEFCVRVGPNTRRALDRLETEAAKAVKRSATGGEIPATT